ncbi:MAG: hypothetical protein ACI8PZ_006512, partial [Myxococcota bacterium]
MRLSRRHLLQSLLAGAMLGRSRPARATPGAAKRVLFVYFPDGVVGPVGDQPSEWHATATDGVITLGHHTEPLAPFVEDCVFFDRLTIGPEGGSHTEGSKKLLTARHGGWGPSIDQVLARSVGADDPWPSLYLGAQTTAHDADIDKFLSVPGEGYIAVPPEDDPRRAFEQLFGPRDQRQRRSVLDQVTADLRELRGRLGGVERARLDAHLDAVREVERRLDAIPACEATLDATGLSDDAMLTPEAFPAIYRAQTDVMVLALACGLTRVGVLQGSHHTSPLVMSRFVTPDVPDAEWLEGDQPSHDSGHYGDIRDERTVAGYAHFRATRRWWTGQLAYLLGRLRDTPEGDGTMLDHSLVVAFSEVSDSNLHSHADMPFVLAGRGGSAVSTGRVLDAEGGLHADLWIALAIALGDPLDAFGDYGTQPL